MKKIWILTLVKRGFIRDPEIYYDAETVNNRKEILLKDFNPTYDEIEIFESNSLVPI
jgi:DNA-binding winged helix-turn-helix (wHTH) protein